MKKIDSQLLVCAASQSQQLVALGILPVACFCYESVAGQWEFAGEYIGQSGVLPAWTKEELNILIGGDFPQIIMMNPRTKESVVKYPKPDLFSKRDWTPSANMMKFVLHLPFKRMEFLNGAEAYAQMLYELIIAKELKPEDCNARLEAFITKDIFNPLAEQLQKEAK